MYFKALISQFQQDAQQTWDKIKAPGGRQLWYHLVAAFTGILLLGLLFITLGTVYFQPAYAFYKKEDMSLPMVLCIVGIGKSLTQLMVYPMQ